MYWVKSELERRDIMQKVITHPTWVNLDVYIVRNGREEKKNDKMVPVLK